MRRVSVLNISNCFCRMDNNKVGARICPLVCVCWLLAALVVNGFDVPMTLLEGAVDKGADFYNWNKVKIRYCDGSSFTGDVDEVDPATKLYFRGAKIWLAVIEDLLAKGMNKAENVGSGGLASILHCDKFHDLQPAGATVKCFSDAGYFINAKMFFPWLHTNNRKDITGTESIKAYYNGVVNTHPIGKAVGDWFYDRSAFRKIDCPYPCDSSCRNRVYD
ncbi:hypothetical protein B296_00025396 [Ensete ventricosum]|uniref:Pectin acetylesterase n=1 Tax=Ensete ventricosum TaxID=4639 RepID=A0A427AEL9_ENSVE|nr:hypothetical protein B296_00025396 [Ensete ventricosum]